ncbi:hypothetical protein MON38_05625 [Hymenobacter sp. DH14]|uniref:Uncharacterized protein n=1 Tax=Hymenobacter cyanobacteriorum TaxID=2926463 RepID=A0A9X2AE71_9BACT|nr:hypothetical protein [Hymenobacter cyanobacteriorum]MCI1186891.1 hypothetical protein [Hymenobacter cyanobacteriorum]
MKKRAVLLLMPGLLATQTAPAPGLGALDQANGFGGIPFGRLDTQVPGLVREASGIGKRWRTTKLFRRPADTLTLAGQSVHPMYWFRNHRFVGVNIDLPKAEGGRVQNYLHQQYGPPQPDPAVAGSAYWLGARTYVLFEPVYPASKGWVLHIASLAMLNEQVTETAVRQQARATLGWQPDSLGLPPQFPR